MPLIDSKHGEIMADIHLHRSDPSVLEACERQKRKASEIVKVPTLKKVCGSGKSFFRGGKEHLCWRHHFQAHHHIILVTM